MDMSTLHVARSAVDKRRIPEIFSAFMADHMDGIRRRIAQAPPESIHQSPSRVALEVVELLGGYCFQIELVVSSLARAKAAAVVAKARRNDPKRPVHSFALSDFFPDDWVREDFPGGKRQFRRWVEEFLVALLNWRTQGRLVYQVALLHDLGSLGKLINELTRITNTAEGDFVTEQELARARGRKTYFGVPL